MSDIPTTQTRAAVRPSSGVIAPQRARWHGRALARLIWLLSNALAASLRWRVEDRSGLLAPGASRKVIFAVWHNRLALSLIIYRDCVVRRTGTHRRMAAMVSASRDGGLLARVLELFGVQPIRGSSSRRGGQALRELTTAAADGLDLALTPDGPRGPCYHVQEGVIAAAQLTGYPIVPVSYWLGWKQTMNSWDKFQVPLPWSRCEVVFGEPIVVPPEATEADRRLLREKLERELKGITRD